MPDLISPILRRSFQFRAVAKDPKNPSYDYAMGLGGSQAMYLVLKESAAELANPRRADTPIEGVIVMDTDYTLQYVDPNPATATEATPTPTSAAAPAPVPTPVAPAGPAETKKGSKQT